MTATDGNEDGDADEDEDDEDELSERDLNTYIRASAAWEVANEALADQQTIPGFGFMSYGIVALGMMNDIMKKARKLYQ